MGNYLNLFLISQSAKPAGSGNLLVTLLPLLLVFVVFYFFMIQPQMKKQKELSNYRNSLKKGDRVVTTGGIYGKVAEVKDNVVILDAGGDVKLKVDKSAVLKDPTDIEQK
ncbi:MAG TPA: preprotein translocase subunit YajC [Bacteroidales bacterium]|nr:preprotein translocase subunit YajC [Bacteroidales bacterium]HCI56433.1 preprotein translocase subunit YajC [Bacteroidales bacterium]HOU95611.1 preprotein translocase subunit YajC [Bacteroidales bacterium]HQG36614.1 preprotein translocase subunit YajC [Bacteroidales bacterium]HQG53214.1 preprotein translocase subunit YajC [Bacteroidales bacterium]